VRRRSSGMKFSRSSYGTKKSYTATSTSHAIGADICLANFTQYTASHGLKTRTTSAAVTMRESGGMTSGNSSPDESAMMLQRRRLGRATCSATGIGLPTESEAQNARRNDTRNHNRPGHAVRRVAEVGSVTITLTVAPGTFCNRPAATFTDIAEVTPSRDGGAIVTGTLLDTGLDVAHEIPRQTVVVTESVAEVLAKMNGGETDE